MNISINIKELYGTINNLKPARSAWGRGVQTYAQMILENVINYVDTVKTVSELKDICLKGAKNWNQYAYGGCGLVYDEAIIKTLCTPSEIKRFKYKEGGYRQPGPNETWIDVEARALYQAWELIKFEAIKHQARKDAALGEV